MILKCAIYCAIFSLPLYSWTKVYKEWKKIREELKKHSLYLQRHICMGVYSAGVLSGWPTEDRAEKSKGFNINTQFEPILYFIRTAERSLDIAIMFIQIKSILDELLAASRRNVKVRIIVDYNYNNNKDLRHLERSGIEVLYYVAPDPDISTIFHHKYMVKDYTDEDGYLYIGSVNWSVGGVTREVSLRMAQNSRD
uniref:Mitochondrial cardiolipin hydrolase n=2 Tax=Photinus pyralis TaxID=7054 RepID=A0A1Y1KVD3_PHOPY